MAKMTNTQKTNKLIKILDEILVDIYENRGKMRSSTIRKLRQELENLNG